MIRSAVLSLALAATLVLAASRSSAPTERRGYSYPNGVCHAVDGRPYPARADCYCHEEDSL